MTIEKFLNYAEKNGINAEKITRGSAYFDNAPELIYDAARVYFAISEKAKIKAVENYCRRCGLSFDLCFHYGRGEYSATVERTEDADALALYYHYQNKCYDLCIGYTHKNRDKMTPAELDRLLYNTMEKYGAAYINELMTGARSYLYA